MSFKLFIENIFNLPWHVKALLIFALCLFIFLLRKPKQIVYHYKSINDLFTQTEKRFYFKLIDAIDGQYQLFAKVRVADVLTPDMEKTHWQAAFNKIKAKHFDYILCNDNLEIIAAIELDDESHQRADRIERDIFLNQACKTANFPLIRFETNQDYSPTQIYRMIKKSLH